MDAQKKLEVKVQSPCLIFIRIIIGYMSGLYWGGYTGGCQNDPSLGTLNIRCRIILGNQKGTIILTMLGSLETLHVTGKLIIHRAPAHKVDHTNSSNLSGSLWHGLVYIRERDVLVERGGHTRVVGLHFVVDPSATTTFPRNKYSDPNP